MQPALRDMVGSLEPSEYSALNIENIRALRAKAVSDEATISYLRRVIQVRLDIINSELNNRRSGASPAEVADLISRLPDILADAHINTASNRPPSSLEVPEVSAELMSLVDNVLPTSRLVSLGELSEDEIRELCNNSESLEREISSVRRKLHEVIDNLGHELALRFQNGESQVGSIET